MLPPLLFPDYGNMLLIFSSIFAGISLTLFTFAIFYNPIMRYLTTEEPVQEPEPEKPPKRVPLKEVNAEELMRKLQQQQKNPKPKKPGDGLSPN